MSRIRLDWSAIFGELHSFAPALLDVFKSYPDTFADALGCISDCHAKIHLREDAVPKCMQSRPVPYAIRAKVDQELGRLEQEDIIERVDFAEWASPVVIVQKMGTFVCVLISKSLSLN